MRHRVLLGLFLCAQASAATLICGSQPCENAAKASEPWPAALKNGFPIKDKSKLEISIPKGFEQIANMNDMIIFDYPQTGKDKKKITIMSLKIALGEKDGPHGGWDVLRTTESNEIKAYFYKEVDEANPTYSAVLTIKNQPTGVEGIKFLVIMTNGFTLEDFKAIFASAKSIGRPSK